MRSILRRLVLVLLVADGASVLAADQPVLGRTFVVSDPSGGKNHRRRNAYASAWDGGPIPALSGDPIATGLDLELLTNGTSSADQVFVLPPGAFRQPNGPGWKRSPSTLRRPAKGYIYVDDRGENGPVTAFFIRNSLSFRMRVTVEARGNNPSVALVPPNPGTGAGFIASFPGGDRYCAIFGPALSARISSQNDVELFKIGRPRARGTCPPSP